MINRFYALGHVHSKKEGKTSNGKEFCEVVLKCQGFKADTWQYPMLTFWGERAMQAALIADGTMVYVEGYGDSRENDGRRYCQVNGGLIRELGGRHKEEEESAF